MTTTTHHHGPIHLLCMECGDYWATEPAPSEDCRYCWKEREAAAHYAARGELPPPPGSYHEDSFLCFPCQAQCSPAVLAVLGYTPEANRRVTPLLDRGSCLSAPDQPGPDRGWRRTRMAEKRFALVPVPHSPHEAPCPLCGQDIDGRTEAWSDLAIVTAEGRMLCDECAAAHLPLSNAFRGVLVRLAMESHGAARGLDDGD